ncbi:YitT family protein [Robertmurraya kyonggiensis]|uniref:YitT family protein n=1 Tax=Robertmurraya kyonggiensis TaxID=1037680 RepID=A0A4U1D469_9BACI|nr:YitT family protein [Robertmurraya kyonggiensis]TKC15926.1 YitT family protein [Robertmurraya kyonggiensis]
MAAIIIGSLLIGVGINGFLIPYHLLDGGVTGISLILHYYFGFPTGLGLFLLSLPFFIFAWFYKRTYFYNNFLGLIVAAIFIDWLEPLRTQFLFSIFTSVLLGGAFIGIGVGVMLLNNVSTGGTDMLAQFISEAFSLNVGVIIFLIDGLIITVAFNVLGLKAFLFSCLIICIIGMITSLIVSHRITKDN